VATAPKLDTARPAMHPDEEAALLDAIQKWVDKEVRPVVLHHDHNDIWPEELVHQMAEMGLFGATIGQEYGGLGLPAVTYAKIVALISSYWMAITGIFNSHLIMACAVERFGTLEQRMRWLPKFASIDFDIVRAGNVKSMVFGGEGAFFASLTGPGHVWIQSLPFARLSARVIAAAGVRGGQSRGEGSLLGGLGDLIDGD
jgi:Acyl-CoA dehydrogenase, N-terminal domain/Mitochondrial biogenesis AIM24